ncbi:MAG: hypothetical protein PHY69_08930 [Dysgonamonadaceae bacterium]|nr:hypothetical protein [Dysgonamonadaceae bacterium]BFD25327.1 MAG: hypothetical protein JST_6180 [Candidatus Parcubacteria bacterium]
MKKNTLIKQGLLYAFGVVVYVSLLSLFMENASGWFGEEDARVITPVAVLLLFIFSALITGGLVLGKPILLYLEGKKKEGLDQLLSTGISLFVYLLIVFLILWLQK